jgi:hypothetical protein
MATTQPIRVIDTLNALERARALQGMHDALFLGNLTLATMSRIRAALSRVGQALSLAYGRSKS